MFMLGLCNQRMGRSASDFYGKALLSRSRQIFSVVFLWSGLIVK